MDYTDTDKIYSKAAIATLNIVEPNCANNNKGDWIRFSDEPHEIETLFVEYYKLYPTWDVTESAGGRIYIAIYWTVRINRKLRRKYNII